LKCPDCGSERVKRAGKYRGKYKTSQGYRCKHCKRFFVERDGFEGKHCPKERDCLALPVCGGPVAQQDQGIPLAALRVQANRSRDALLGEGVIGAYRAV